jgi:hypothetical protein
MSDNTGLFKRIVTAFTNLASGAPDQYRGTLTNKVAVTNVPANLYGWILTNPNAIPVYVKFYDQTASPVVGTDAVAYGPLQVPASGQFGLSGTDVLKNFSTAIWAAVTTSPDDGSSSAPGTGIYFSFIYKR